MNINNKGKLCRGCLSTNFLEFQAIFEKSGRISKIFSMCTQLEVSENDGLPDVICNKCLSRCDTWFTFRAQCIRSYIKFGQNLNKLILKDPLHLDLNSIDNPKSVDSSLKQTENQTFFDAELTEEINESESFRLDETDSEFEDIKCHLNEKRMKKARKKKQCNKCEKVFRLQAQLDAHINKDHLGIEAVKCPICNMGLSSIGNLRRHHLLLHDNSKTKNFTCKVCNKTFMFRSALLKHGLIHKNIKSFICDICGKGFIHKSGLVTHMLSHSTETPFPCDVCGKRFKSQDILKIHRRRHDNSTKPYVCSNCGKMFSTSGELTTHSRTHSGIRPYDCDQCPKSFKTISQLYVHRRVHSGDRPFSCNLCLKTFTAAEVLKNHRLIHFEEKPHECTVCQRRFRQKCALTTHMKRHNK